MGGCNGWALVDLKLGGLKAQIGWVSTLQPLPGGNGWHIPFSGFRVVTVSQVAKRKPTTWRGLQFRETPIYFGPCPQTLTVTTIWKTILLVDLSFYHPLVGRVQHIVVLCPTWWTPSPR